MQGPSQAGTVYELDVSGQLTYLHVFAQYIESNDGAEPYGGLVIDSSGNLYGTTLAGGGGGEGTAYVVNPGGGYRIIYNFGLHGGYPYSGPILDSEGNLYGTTEYGGTFNAGVVYMLTQSGTETVLYNFTGGADGGRPYGGLAFDAAGNLYGTTFYGGAANKGVVYEVNTSGQETVLHSFAGGADGGYSWGGVTLDVAGNVFGTASDGGKLGGGVVFKLSP
jgi:uncharacterized repeat protein (TIGR03803 family)